MSFMDCAERMRVGLPLLRCGVHSSYAGIDLLSARGSKPAGQRSDAEPNMIYSTGALRRLSTLQVAHGLRFFTSRAEKKPIRVAITGAAGAIGYAMTMRVAG